jgi:hypothetical protein
MVCSGLSREAARLRHAFTFVEALVAAALAAVVLGGTAMMYVQGNRAFTATTEHASFREEALLLLETIDRDLKGLVVSDEMNPRTGLYYMVQPFELLDPVDQVGTDPATGRKRSYPVSSGLEFHKYHRTQMVPGRDGPTAQMVGQLVTYRIRPIDAADPRRGVDLLRNGRKINRQPLSGVLFERADPIHAARNVGAAPNATLKVTVVPRGGLWGTMTPDTIQKLRDDGKVATRMFHLVGYESQFTTLLWLAIAKSQAGLPVDPLEDAVLAYGDALPAGLGGDLRRKVKEISDMGYRLDPGRIVLETVPFDETTAGQDAVFAAAREDEGLPASSVLPPRVAAARAAAAAAGLRAGSGSSTGGLLGN